MNSNAKVQARNNGGTRTDHITVVIADGTTHDRDLHSFPTRRSSDLSGTITGAVTEAGGVSNGTPGTPTATGTLTDTDIDNPIKIVQALAWSPASTDGHGT